MQRAIVRPGEPGVRGDREYQRTAGLEHPRHLPHRRTIVVDVLQYVRGHHQIECAAGEGDGGAACAAALRRAAPRGELDRDRAGLEAHDAAERRERGGIRAGTGTEIEHPTRRDTVRRRARGGAQQRAAPSHEPGVGLLDLVHAQILGGFHADAPQVPRT
ncbi:MAG TPA: hypothetical protein VFW66_08850 [Gemmatimonadales bacterium]|nr:hypothetical protein [Gemmatimonadales bacterium]